jgi:hypothetical protein
MAGRRTRLCKRAVPMQNCQQSKSIERPYHPVAALYVHFYKTYVTKMGERKVSANIQYVTIQSSSAYAKN